MVGFFPLDIFINNLYSKQIGLSEKTWVPRSVFRVPLLIFDFKRFPEESPKLPANCFFRCLVRASCWDFSSSWYTNHMVGFQSFRQVALFLWSGMEGFLSPCLSQKVPYFLGDQEFLGGLLRTCQRCPGNSFPCPIFVVAHWQRRSLGIYYLLSNRITLVAVFP